MEVDRPEGEVISSGWKPLCSGDDSWEGREGDPSISTQLASRGDSACVRPQGPGQRSPSATAHAQPRRCGRRPAFPPGTATSEQPASQRRTCVTLGENAEVLGCCYYSREAKHLMGPRGWSARGACGEAGPRVGHPPAGGVQGHPQSVWCVSAADPPFRLSARGLRPYA